MVCHSRILRGKTSLFLLLCITLLLSGCATKPWLEPADTGQITVLEDALHAIRQQEQTCSACVDGNVRIFIENKVKKRGFEGYLLTMPPGTIKFIASNPFGQPLLALAGDNSTFKYLNTQEKIYWNGDTGRLFEELGFPADLLSPHWSLWLLGQLPENLDIQSARKDKKSSDIWVTAAEAATELNEHLLISLDRKQLISRLVTQGQKTMFRVDYHYETDLAAPADSSCRVPERVIVSGLDFGTNLSLYYSDTQMLDDCSDRDFLLPRPGGYHYRQF